MLAISVELLHGTFRGDPDGTANTGPPDPWRVAALSRAPVRGAGGRPTARATGAG